MIYTQTYPVNRLMHMRPCGEASKAAETLQKQYGGLQVVLQNNRNGVIVEGHGMIRYMTELQPHMGDRVIISLIGDFSEVQLKEGSEKIGQAFSSFEEIPRVREYFFD